MFPDELIQLNNWCVWRWIQKNGKQTKIPINAETGELAKSNDKSTWSDYETAFNVFQDTNADGLGFFFEPPYVGVDIDDVSSEIDRFKNNDFENNLVFELYELLKTYAEISPSGNGIHLIFKGKIPGPARRKGNVEMYTEGRFFTMTGDSLKKYKTINEPSEGSIDFIYRKYVRPENVTQVNFNNNIAEHNLSDSEVIRSAIDSRQGSRFKELLDGKMEGYTSQSEADIAFANMLAFWTAKDFQQMDRIFRKSGLYRDKWDEKRGKTTYGEGTLYKAINETGDVYTPTQKRKTLKYNFGDGFANNKKQKEYPVRSWDDTGNADRFMDRFGEIVRYSYTNKDFYVYTGQKWELDNRGLVRQMVDVLVEEMKKEKPVVIEGVDEEEVKDNWNKFLKTSRSNTRKKAIIDEIKHRNPVMIEDFDTSKMLLNVENGYLDLSSGELKKHDKEKMFSKQANIEFTDKSDCPTWESFLADIFNKDNELISFIKRAVGYSITASIDEQVMFILYGFGRNGKSVFLEVISEILGDYASTMQAETILIKRQQSSATSDVARLNGARFVKSSEPNEGRRLDEGLVKQMTGGEKMTARFLHQNEFEFLPQFKIWLASNHKPVINGTDDGIWRRMMLIPFEVQIPDHKVDKHLKTKLMREAPAILNWALEGAMEWQKIGLQPPEKVLKESQKYRREMDVLEQFIEDECEVGEEYLQKPQEFYEAYKEWAKRNEEYLMPNKKFGVKMKEKFEYGKKSINKVQSRYYFGVRVKEKYPGMKLMK